MFSKQRKPCASPSCAPVMQLQLGQVQTLKVGEAPPSWKFDWYFQLQTRLLAARKSFTQNLLIGVCVCIFTQPASWLVESISRNVCLCVSMFVCLF